MEIRTKEQYISYIRRTTTIPTGIDGSTAIKLIEEMIDALLIDWSNPNLKILDPGFGFGGYLFFVYLKLAQFHSEEHILNNMLYGVEIEDFRFELVKHKLKIKNLIKGDFLDNKIFKNMKFDAIIGNPPYQDGERSDQANKLWPKFIKKSSELLSTNGIMSFVTPNGWMNSKTADIGKGKGGINIFNDIFKKKNLLYVNYDSSEIRKKYFPDVGSTFTIFIYQNSEYGGKTEFFKYDSGSEIYDISDVSDLPQYISATTFSILEKITKNTDKFNFIDQNHNLNGIETSIKTPEFKYKCFHTHKNGGTYWYGNKKSWFAGKYNVAITLSGKYLATLTTDSFSNMCLGIPCETENEANNIVSILNSSLYKFIVFISKFSGFNPRSTILKLPKLKNKFWIDDDIYEHFNITNEELKYIETKIK